MTVCVVCLCKAQRKKAEEDAQQLAALKQAQEEAEAALAKKEGADSGDDEFRKKSKKIILPGLEGLSLYNLWVIYWGGIVRGTFSARASSIAFSFFMAIFPFLLFVLNLIPYITFIDDFQIYFLLFMDTLLPP